MLTDEKVTRNRILDWCKVLAIWQIILQHMKFPVEFVSFDYQFAIPIFFLVAGFLDHDLSLWGSIKKGATKLLVPYVALYLITYPFWFSSYIRHPELYFDGFVSDAILKPILGLFASVGYQTSFSTTVNAPLWFLVGLFMCKVMNCALYNLSGCKKALYALLVALLIPMTVIIKRLGIDLLFSLDSALLALPLYATGFLTQLLWGADKIDTMRKYIKWWWSIPCAILTIAIWKINGRMDVDSFRFGNNILLFLISGITGAMTVIALASGLEKLGGSWITHLAYGTIIILAFHQYVFKVMLVFVRINILPLFYAIEVVISIVTLLLLIPVIRFVQKRFPLLLGWRNYTTSSEVSSALPKREKYITDEAK